MPNFARKKLASIQNKKQDGDSGKNVSNSTNITEIESSRHETYDRRNWDEILPNKADDLVQQNDATKTGAYAASSTTPLMYMNPFVPIPYIIPDNVRLMYPTYPFMYPQLFPSGTYYRSFAKYHEMIANNFTTLQPPVAFRTNGISNDINFSNMTNHHFASSSNPPQEVVQSSELPSTSNRENVEQPKADNAVSTTNSSKPFICEECKKQFSLRRILKRHMKCHGERIYDCWYCDKSFNDIFDLKRHVRIHTGVRPYQCDVCEKAFTQRCSLESHLKKIHSIKFNYGFKERRSKIYVCEDCSFISKSGSDYQAHIRLEHPDSAWLIFRRDKARELKIEKIRKLKKITQGSSSRSSNPNKV